MSLVKVNNHSHLEKVSGRPPARFPADLRRGFRPTSGEVSGRPPVRFPTMTKITTTSYKSYYYQLQKLLPSPTKATTVRFPTNTKTTTTSHKSYYHRLQKLLPQPTKATTVYNKSLILLVTKAKLNTAVFFMNFFLCFGSYQSW